MTKEERVFLLQFIADVKIDGVITGAVWRRAYNIISLEFPCQDEYIITDGRDGRRWTKVDPVLKLHEGKTHSFKDVDELLSCLPPVATEEFKHRLAVDMARYRYDINQDLTGFANDELERVLDAFASYGKVDNHKETATGQTICASYGGCCATRSRPFVQDETLPDGTELVRLCDGSLALLAGEHIMTDLSATISVRGEDGVWLVRKASEYEVFLKNSVDTDATP